MKRPVVLALNPSIDAEWQVDGVRWEEKNNVLTERRWAGGKGVNVARWLNHLGAKPQLILPLGGASGRELAAQLRAEKISTTIIRLFPSSEGVGVGSPQHATRVNVIITTKTQGQIRFNPLGPQLSKHEWRTILNSVEQSLIRWGGRPHESLPHANQRLVGMLAAPSGLLILSGSLPRGVPANAYPQIIRLARAHQVPVLLDCDGPALATAVRAQPFLVKPNEHELLEWARSAGLRPGMNAAAIRHAALALSRVTHGWVLVSRGAQPALLVNARTNSEFTARPPKCKPRNTVGAGDALLAAVAQQVMAGAAPEAWLRHGLAAGSAATQVEAGQLP